MTWCPFKREHRPYPACVGLGSVGTSPWPWRQQRVELWNDTISRPFPWNLRLVPSRWITWDRRGAKLAIFS